MTVVTQGIGPCESPVRNMSWWCDGEQLSVRVKGPWILDASDIPSALENLLQDLRDRGLDAQEDGVGIVLEAILVDGSARFRPCERLTTSDESTASEQELRCRLADGLQSARTPHRCHLFPSRPSSPSRGELRIGCADASGLTTPPKQRLPAGAPGTYT